MNFDLTKILRQLLFTILIVGALIGAGLASLAWYFL